MKKSRFSQGQIVAANSIGLDNPAKIIPKEDATLGYIESVMDSAVLRISRSQFSGIHRIAFPSQLKH